jgi:hypothetical protein
VFQGEIPSFRAISTLTITSLSMPSLTTAGTGEGQGLNIISYGNPINISLPKLANASPPIIAGNIERRVLLPYSFLPVLLKLTSASVYLPSFTNSYDIFQFETQTPMYLNLSYLEHAYKLLITGAIKGYDRRPSFNRSNNDLI